MCLFEGAAGNEAGRAIKPAGKNCLVVERAGLARQNDERVLGG